MTLNLLIALTVLAAPDLHAARAEPPGAEKDSLAAFHPSPGLPPEAAEQGLTRFFDRAAALPAFSKEAPAPRVDPSRSGSGSPSVRMPPASPKSGLAAPAAAAPGRPSSRRYEKLVERMLSREETSRYDTLILRYAERYQIGPGLLKAVIAAESEFKAGAKSRAGALGLMQVMPKTAEGMGVSRHSLLDPEANIKAGAAYLAHLFKILYRRNGLKGSFAAAPKWIARRAIACYNGGLRFLKNRPLYRETRGYLAKVLYFWSSELSRLRLPSSGPLLASRY